MSTLPEQSEPAPIEPEQTPAAGLWVELVVVYCLAVLPFLVNAFYFLWGPQGRRASSAWDTVIEVSISTQICVPVLYIMYRSGKPWEFFGISRPRWFWDFYWTVFILFAFVLVMRIIAWPLPDDSGVGVRDDRNLFRISLSYFSIAVAEEMVLRGYFIPRLEELTGSTIESVLLSSVLFASYHVYLGIGGTLRVFAMGIVLGIVFCLTRRLWPLIAAHMIWDIAVHLLRLPQ